MIPLLFILSSIFLAFGSKSKGYSPKAWTFACGVIGVAVMSLLPNLSPIIGKEPFGVVEKRKRGNTIGWILTVITIPMIPFWIYATFLFTVSTGSTALP